MSSAAVQQSTPQHQQSPAGRDRYSQNYQSASPSSRRAGGSGSGYASRQNPPQQAQYASPPGSAGMSTPRAQQFPQNTYGQDTMNSSTYQQFYPDQAGNGPATALPIRTSSQQAPTSSAAAPYDSRGYPRDGSGYASGSERERASDNERRQRSQRSPQADPSSASRSQRSRNAASAPQHSRSATAVGQTPLDTSLPRENSAIIKHIVVDDPQTDVARERARVAEAQPHQSGMEPGMVDQSMPAGDSQRKHRSRQEHLRQSTQRKEVKFGDYILGQTLGEGEFGKVKMGWKKDSTVQVAIKLIRKESLQSNSSRLPKIYREIAILRELQHPNIVRLHEFVETERHMGIILEYASGGELFDYILNHRYLKDPAARRLFAQLVSGVGYLHKKGIVHRDLKLENLLLDRNRNIIITDFGFANTFNPGDELSEEVVERISDKEFVKREGLGEVDQKSGFRRGDLMQTSCGSPCYAAPELVVSDGLYTGRKVDVWSCGVILYAMLAGYLPFDDDPANPEGDNINLLYKYIVSTPLTFPEYVSPHARDLLRRILVPDPKSRADLFEVARHSWLSEYSHVVGFIGSSNKSDRDIAKSAAQQGQDPLLGRSASVREPASRSPAAMSAGGVQKQAPVVGDAPAANTQRDAKRRTVQLEYVAPKDANSRGETSPTAVGVPPVSGGRTRARGDLSGPTEVAPNSKITVPRKEVGSSQMPPPVRPTRDQARAASDSTAFAGNQTSYQTSSASRPNTQGTLGSARLPSRGNSYSQPAVASPTTATAQGHFSQPKSNTGYIISGNGEQTQDNRPISQQNLAQYQQQRLQQQEQQAPSQRGHKRSSTLGSIGDRIMGRSNSRRASQQQEKPNTLEKRDRKYPPVSMRTAIPNDAQEVQPRTSTESSRRTSFGFSRKTSEAPSENKRSSRRFSFLPGSGSMSNLFGGKKDQSYDPAGGQYYNPRDTGRPESKGMAFGRGASRSPSMSTTNSTIPMYYEADRETARNQRRSAAPQSQAPRNPAYEKVLPPQPQQSQAQTYGTPPPVSRKQFRDDGYGGNLLDPSRTPQPGQEPVERYWTPSETLDQAQSPQSPAGYNSQGQYMSSQQPAEDGYGYGAQEDLYDDTVQRQQSQQMRQPQRKFAHEYEGGNSGSSSATRRVMDFFRRRGKDRSEV